MRSRSAFVISEQSERFNVCCEMSQVRTRDENTQTERLQRKGAVPRPRTLRQHLQRKGGELSQARVRNLRAVIKIQRLQRKGGEIVNKMSDPASVMSEHPDRTSDANP